MVEAVVMTGMTNERKLEKVRNITSLYFKIAYDTPRDGYASGLDAWKELTGESVCNAFVAMDAIKKTLNRE